VGSILCCVVEVVHNHDNRAAVITVQLSREVEFPQKGISLANAATENRLLAAMRSTRRLLASMEIDSSGGSVLSGTKKVIVRSVRSPAWTAAPTTATTVQAMSAIVTLNSPGEIIVDWQAFRGRSHGNCTG
jgi:hypothetical protein